MRKFVINYQVNCKIQLISSIIIAVDLKFLIFHILCKFINDMQPVMQCTIHNLYKNTKNKSI